ncbi:Imm53 family immunity protein [Nocardioides sp. YIM B13467]|uniref:Imm53 family immunity protein n=1 Tax=Nocardioides sp. YIM B13467 TaxID=3366294 RepID=UPI00366B0705
MAPKIGRSRSGSRDESAGFRFIIGWYADQCDGEWEHEFGVKIETIDNPGWSVTIDLVDTEAHGSLLEFSTIELPRRGWIGAMSDGERFIASGSPGAASEIDQAFEDFIAGRALPSDLGHGG